MGLNSLWRWLCREWPGPGLFLLIIVAAGLAFVAGAFCYWVYAAP